ncbi:SH3-domain-containing protein, partial [Schizophyllum commune Tattone D]
MTASTDALSLLIQQTRQNVELLIANNKISALDGRDILAKLPTGNVDDALARSVESLSVSSAPTMPSMPSVQVPSYPSPPSSTPFSPPPAAPPAPKTQQARALWGYNEDGKDANDLTFSAGETIDIVEETNADWWTGRARGKQGLFPSNYVEKIGAPSSAPPSAYKSASPAPYNNASPAHHNNSSPAPYKAPPYQPAYQPTYQAPPPGPPPQAQYMPYNAGSVSMQAPQPQQPPAEEPKKSKFGGKLGNTLAHSAVGGVGFGAGSAVGSGIINSIF